MSNTREGLNPLRPYYIPPSIGLPSESKPTANLSSFESTGENATYVPSARNIFSDIDYSNYVPESSQSTLDNIRSLLDDALHKYISVLLAQPFEVAKTILQVKSQSSTNGPIAMTDEGNMRERYMRPRDSMHTDFASDDSDLDEPTYFTSAAQTSSCSPHRLRRHVTGRGNYVIPPESSHQLTLKCHDSIIEVISQLWTKEGAWGVWKCSNATFVYSALWKTIETWSRSMLSALFNVPDPGLSTGLGVPVDVTGSAYPWASLGVAVTAAAMTGIILAPLDIVRTKLILTSTSALKRGFFHNVQLLPSYLCPPQLIIPTILHNIVSPLMIHSTSLLLRSRLNIDPILTPTLFSIATFFSSTVELFLRLPLETVLRRGQVSVLSSQTYGGEGMESATIVNVGSYKGPIRTMWMIVHEEGVSSDQDDISRASGSQATRNATKKRERKGQGIEGLWRGWRVGFWGLVGVWGAATIGGVANSRGEF